MADRDEAPRLGKCTPGWERGQTAGRIAYRGAGRLTINKRGFRLTLLGDSPEAKLPGRSPIDTSWCNSAAKLIGRTQQPLRASRGASRSLTRRHAGAQPVELHELVFHSAQALGAWLFIIGAALRLELHVVPSQSRSALKAAVESQRELARQAQELAERDELTYCSGHGSQRDC